MKIWSMVTKTHNVKKKLLRANSTPHFSCFSKAKVTKGAFEKKNFSFTLKFLELFLSLFSLKIFLSRE